VKGGKMMQHDKLVDIESFEITKYEITNEEYALFLNVEKIGSDGVFNGRQIINVLSEDLQLEYKNGNWECRPGKDKFPMVMVNYFGALEFCKWKGGRLPTETEWTLAAKGGHKSKNFTFAGGNKFEEVGWFKDNSEGHSHKIGQKKPNELGIYDMSGNAWEWCLNDSLKSETDFCVHKGGSWYAEEQPGQISAHYGNVPTHFSNSVGFRVVFPIKKRKINIR
jgi:formylglycine-generating enzyme required for sulfatase activity